ncbi:MAG: putative Co/Zn/Cd efflux system rane fusion protein [Myxococcaceae bacterium]|nr:putative Co/Zn/Cd efflux system rane fusion protein [Myxococcaceae bacterium]
MSNERAVGPGAPAPGEADPPLGERKPHAQSEHQEFDLGFELPQAQKLSGGRSLLFLLIAAAIVGAAFLFGYVPRQRADKALADSTHSQAQQPLRVDTINPRRLDDSRTTLLPASIQPFKVTTLYPRAQGYVRSYSVDIGDRVKEGQKLAEIETPEIDQQLDQGRAELLQAEARLLQAQANRDLANTSLARYKALRPAGVASQQELDQRSAQALVDESNVKAAEAAIGVQRANVRRLQQLKAFANIVAPFAGMITARTIEPGALVSPSTASPLFELTATDPVRVFVQVPQNLAPSVHPKARAKVLVREFPTREFEGEIARAAGALDNQTRTMRTEVRVPNPDGTLITGMYANVQLPLATPHAVFEVPATAVIADARGARVALVTDDGVLHLRPITIERDQGGTIQIASGVSADDHIVRFASSSLQDGQKVLTARADKQ